MKDVVIKIENLSKSYRLGEFGTGTISHDLNRAWARFRGKEDPYQKVGGLNDRTKKATKGEVVAALNDINLEVREGEVLGVIGRNGAGKSTLLKVLSRVTSPTSGRIGIRGRLASLLEVGTGFHPEMTGRENIYMNGTIMGMRKWEINGKLDEIVEFAGVAKYLDTPVKRYSSGMTVRLGFAVAAFLEPEILIVDEVLAVGDAEFQKKAIGKMNEISKGQGRTVMLVSHNMTSINSLCDRAVVLSQGQIDFDGPVSEAVAVYLAANNDLEQSKIWSESDAIGTEDVKLMSVRIQSGSSDDDDHFIGQGDAVNVFFSVKVLKEGSITLDFTFNIIDEYNNKLFVSSTLHGMEPKQYSKGIIEMCARIPSDLLMIGKYRIGRFIVLKNRSVPLFGVNSPASFEVMNRKDEVYVTEKIGLIRPKVDWNIKISI